MTLYEDLQKEAREYFPEISEAKNILFALDKLKQKGNQKAGELLLPYYSALQRENEKKRQQQPLLHREGAITFARTMNVQGAYDFLEYAQEKSDEDLLKILKKRAYSYADAPDAYDGPRIQKEFWLKVYEITVGHPYDGPKKSWENYSALMETPLEDLYKRWE